MSGPFASAARPASAATRASIMSPVNCSAGLLPRARLRAHATFSQQYRSVCVIAGSTPLERLTSAYRAYVRIRYVRKPSYSVGQSTYTVLQCRIANLL